MKDQKYRILLPLLLMAAAAEASCMIDRDEEKPKSKGKIIPRGHHLFFTDGEEVIQLEGDELPDDPAYCSALNLKNAKRKFQKRGFKTTQ